MPQEGSKSRKRQSRVNGARSLGDAESLLAGLNKAQREAVLHDTGPVLVIAGAGTGKTKVITNRIAFLILTGKAHPEEILALTFTDKAAQEMQDRVDELLPYGVVETSIMTFHALGGLLLRDHALDLQLHLQLRLATPVQQHMILRDVLESQAKLEYFRPAQNPTMYTDLLLRYFSRLKDEALNPTAFRKQVDAFSDDMAEKYDQGKYWELAQIYELYEVRKREQGFMDFGDQLLLPYELLLHKPHILTNIQDQYKYLLVDEFQDTNAVQAKLLYLLSKKQQNIMVVGDDDQSVYRFRGAELQNILSFDDIFPQSKHIVLTKNYRSTQRIIDPSYELIQHNNPDRLESKLGISKRLEAQRKGRAVEILELQDLRAEIDRVTELVHDGIQEYDPNQVAVITRNNTQVEMVIQALRQKDIPVATQVTKNLLLQPVVRQCMDFLSVVHDSNDSSALYRYLLSPKVAAEVAEIIQLASEAKSKHATLEATIRSRRDEYQYLSGQLEIIQGYRRQIQDNSVGELLYDFITSGGYLDMLISQAEEDPASGHAVQNLARFFQLIAELEAVEGVRNSHDLWLHIKDMYDLEVLADPDEAELSEGVQVLTAHRSKGLEFDRVILFDVVDGTFPATRKGETLYLPQQMSTDSSVSVARLHLAEERRLFYVALTRAKQDVFITFSRNHGGKRLKKPSRFLLEAFGYDIKSSSISKPGLSAAVIHQYGPTSTPSHKPSYPEQDGWLQLTPNQIADYVQDPQYFYVRHVLRFPEKPSHRLVYGTAIHAVLEVYLRQRMLGSSVGLDDLFGVLNQAWSHEGFVSLRHEEERLGAAKETIRRVWTDFETQQLDIIDVERPFHISLDECKVRIRGRYDVLLRTDSGVEIRDFKTSAVKDLKTAQNRVRDSIPMQIYALAWGLSQEAHEDSLGSISLHFVDSGIVARRDKLNHIRTRDQIAKVAEGIRAGLFPKKGIHSHIEMEGLM